MAKFKQETLFKCAQTCPIVTTSNMAGMHDVFATVKVYLSYFQDVLNKIF